MFGSGMEWVEKPVNSEMARFLSESGYGAAVYALGSIYHG
jgi:hypothetical protein